MDRLVVAVSQNVHIGSYSPIGQPARSVQVGQHSPVLQPFLATNELSQKNRFQSVPIAAFLKILSVCVFTLSFMYILPLDLAGETKTELSTKVPDERVSP